MIDEQEYETFFKHFDMTEDECKAAFCKISKVSYLCHMRIQRGTGCPDPPPPGKLQKCSFFSNTGPDPLQIVKLPSRQSILGHNRHASETTFKWSFAGGPMMAHLSLFLDHSPPPHQTKKNTQKKNFKVGPPLTKLSGSAHELSLFLQTF